MYIKNGVAFAGEPMRGIRVVDVRVVNELSMLVTFSTGEVRLFDASHLLELPAFAALADMQVFKNVSIEHGVMCWQGGQIDIAPEYVYENSFAYETEPLQVA